MLILLTGAVSEDTYRLKLGVSKGNLYLRECTESQKLCLAKHYRVLLQSVTKYLFQGTTTAGRVKFSEKFRFTSSLQGYKSHENVTFLRTTLS